MSLKKSLDELRKELARRKADRKDYDDLPYKPTPDYPTYGENYSNSDEDIDCNDDDGDGQCDGDDSD